jgi:hypothetical protein
VSSEDEGYVHDPEAFRERENGTDTGAEFDATAVEADVPDGTETNGDGFDLRGWVLVGVVVVAFLVIPIAILVQPPGVPLWAALLALPMLPALLLGAAAVWAMLGRR